MSTSPLDKYYESEYGNCKGLMEKIKTVLTDVKSYLSGDSILTNYIHSVIQGLKHGVVPWSQNTPSIFFKSLSARWKFVCTKLTSSSGPVNLGLVADIGGFLTASRQEFATLLSVSLEKLAVSFKMEPPKNSLSFEIIGLESQCCEMENGKIRLCEDIGLKSFPSCYVHWAVLASEYSAKIPAYKGLKRDSVIFYLDTSDLIQSDISKMGIALII
jgi:Dynein heavy chain C-terminal domain